MLCLQRAVAALLMPHHQLSSNAPFPAHDDSDSDDDAPPSFLLPRTAYDDPRSAFLCPPRIPSRHSSLSSTATSTPVPSRTASPHPHPPPQLYPSSSCPSDTDDEPTSPLLPWRASRSSWWREQRGQWWTPSRRRRPRSWRITRVAKRWLRSIIHHPLFPSQPITIVRPHFFIRICAHLPSRSSHSSSFPYLLSC